MTIRKLHTYIIQDFILLPEELLEESSEDDELELELDEEEDDELDDSSLTSLTGAGLGFIFKCSLRSSL